MNILKRLALRRLRGILRHTFVQGYQHRMQELFNEVYAACAREFREDNVATMDGFLGEMLAKASASYWGPLAATSLVGVLHRDKHVVHVFSKDTFDDGQRAYKTVCGVTYRAIGTHMHTGIWADVTCPKCKEIQG